LQPSGHLSKAAITGGVQRIANGWPSERNRRAHAVELRRLNGRGLSLFHRCIAILGHDRHQRWCCFL